MKRYFLSLVFWAYSYWWKLQLKSLITYSESMILSVYSQNLKKNIEKFKKKILIFLPSSSHPTISLNDRRERLLCGKKEVWKTNEQTSCRVAMELHVYMQWNASKVIMKRQTVQFTVFATLCQTCFLRQTGFKKFVFCAASGHAIELHCCIHSPRWPLGTFHKK